MAEERAADPELRYHLLLDLARRLSRTLDLQEILADLLKSLHAAIPYDAAGVFALNRSISGLGPTGSNLIAGMAQVGFDALRADDPMLRWGQGIVGHVIRTGETVLTGLIEDRSALFGVVAQIEALGLELIELRKITSIR